MSVWTEDETVILEHEDENIDSASKLFSSNDKTLLLWDRMLISGLDKSADVFFC